MLWNPDRGGGGGGSTTLIDSFEDQSLSEYTGATNEFDTVDPTTLGTSWSAPDGDYVARNQSGQGTSNIASFDGDGLPNYFPKGNIARCYVRSTGLEGSVRVTFGRDGFGDHYAAQVGYGVGNVRILRYDSGSATELAIDSSVSVSADTTGYLEITWDDGTLGGSDNDITVEYVEGGTSLSTISANDPTYAASTGIGVIGVSNNSADYFIDWYHLR